MRWAPIASDSVTVGSRPSGTRATVTPTANRKPSPRGHAHQHRQREEPRAHRDRHRGDDPRHPHQLEVQGAGRPPLGPSQAGDARQAGSDPGGHHRGNGHPSTTKHPAWAVSPAAGPFLLHEREHAVDHHHREHGDAERGIPARNARPPATQNNRAKNICAARRRHAGTRCGAGNSFGPSPAKRAAASAWVSPRTGGTPATTIAARAATTPPVDRTATRCHQGRWTQDHDGEGTKVPRQSGRPALPPITVTGPG
jgi:hypothetical protein